METRSRSAGQAQSPVASTRIIVVAATAAGIGVAALSYAVERWLEVPRAGFLVVDLADQLIAGLTTALCVYFVWQKGRRSQLLDRQRFQLISASTQQIRDALQLITDSTQPGSPQQSVIIYAVDHIEWVLQEVLPAVHQDPKQVRERVKEYGASADDSSIPPGNSSDPPSDSPDDSRQL